MDGNKAEKDPRLRCVSSRSKTN